MNIAGIRSWSDRIPLTRPYRIASAATDAADLVIVEIVDDAGNAGLGSAAPVPAITGETPAACAAALEPDRLAWLVGRDVADFRSLAAKLATGCAGTPAARAAVDIALHDLAARRRGIPLVDLLGRVHEALPTSITIGIKPESETLVEAAEYVGRGFGILKIKIGSDFDAEIARLERVRAAVPRDVVLRVDANEALSLPQTEHLAGVAVRLGIELIEQPLARANTASLGALPAPVRRIIALDESIQSEDDARSLAASHLAGIFNVKLMKCGGITPALAIASIAQLAGISLMWGCMDESVIGIAAALHAAFACRATRYLDLDGSFDLARDPASGGFDLVDGCLRTLPAPGLGVRLVG